MAPVQPPSCVPLGTVVDGYDTALCRRATCHGSCDGPVLSVSILFP